MSCNNCFLDHYLGCTDPILGFTNAVKLDRLNLEITIMMLVVMMMIIMIMIMIIIMIMIMIMIIIITENDDNRTNYKTVIIVMITMY